MAAQFGWNAREHPRRLLAFALDAKASAACDAAAATASSRMQSPATSRSIAAAVALGIEQYTRCVVCHGPGAVAGGSAPDLRASTDSAFKQADFAAVVRDGRLESRGMPKFQRAHATASSKRSGNYIRYRASLAAGK